MPENNPITPKVAWISTDYKRGTWVLQKHGKTIEPPNEQESNNDFRREEVLQPRDESVGSSHAFPLNGGSPEKPTGGIAPTSGII